MAGQDGATLPPYTVRRSRRAKRVTLRVAPRVGLEVVVPFSFDVARVPDIVAARADWAERNLQILYDRGFDPAAADEVPDALNFRSVGKKYRLEMLDVPGRKPQLRQQGPGRLVLCGDGSDADACRLAVME